jgi:DNA-binding TFAR19-related protein (PDSD5 family)
MGRASAPADDETDAAMHAGLTPEETERLRQLEMARRAIVSAAAPGPARDIE